MMSIIIFFIILSILVLVHELGHFLAAKRNGVCVEEFGFGLPPRVFGFKKGETIYSLNLLPFGGFVKVLGEEQEDLKGKNLPRNLTNRTFMAKKPWQRAFIIVAGVIANFLLGWLIISYLFTQGVPALTDKVIVEKVIANSPAKAAGIKPNDIIKSLSVKNNQTKTTVYPLKSTEVLINLSKKFDDRLLTLIIERNGHEFTTSVYSRRNPPKGQGPLGIVITSFIEKKYSWFQAPIFGIIESFKISIMTAKELVKMLFNFITLQKTNVDVTGPIGIAKITSQAVKFGNNAVLQVLGLLSLNLAVINIFPFPALDGGRLALIVYEAISRKKVNSKVEKRLNLIGFTILITLIILVSINDIIKLFK